MSSPTALVLTIVGVILSVIGVANLFCFAPGYSYLFNKKTTLANGSAIFDDWVDPASAKIYMKYYFLSVTNPEDVVQARAKPSVQEIGPLTYRELQPKLNVSQNSGSATVTYLNNHTYVFEPTMSGIEEDTVITVPNMVFWTTLYTADKTFLERFFVQGVVNHLEKSSNESLRNSVQPFFKIQAADYLWGLKDNPLLVSLMQQPTKFGLQANNSLDGVYEVYTGVGSHNRRRASIKSWNGSPKLDYWGNEYCNAINGTDGSLFNTFIQPNEQLYAFDTNICRSIFFERTNVTSVMNGVPTSRFVIPKEAFQVSEDTLCFCAESNKSRCLNGLLDVSKCYAENLTPPGSDPPAISAVMTAPHFLFCDEETINSVHGMHPNLTRHQTYIDVNTMSGLVVDAAKRIQLNTYLRKPKDMEIDSLANFTDGRRGILMPVFWAEQVLLPSRETTAALYDAVVLPYNVANTGSYCMIGAGCLFLLLALAILILRDRKYASSLCSGGRRGRAVSASQQDLLGPVGREDSVQDV